MPLLVATELLVASPDMSAEADATDEWEEESESRTLDVLERLRRGLPDDESVRGALLVADAAAVDDADEDGDGVEELVIVAEPERAGDVDTLTEELANLDADALVVGSENVGTGETEGWPDALLKSVAEAHLEALKDSRDDCDAQDVGAKECESFDVLDAVALMRAVNVLMDELDEDAVISFD
jgi:hypothetical protein